MLYHLFDYFQDWNLPGQGLWQYLSFRAMLSSITAMLIAVFAGKKVIKWLQKKQIGETIRDLGLEGQMQKKGTPTMGGIIIFIAIIVSALLFADLTNIYIILLFLTTIWFFMIGFTDDYIKVFKHDKNGLSEKAKLAGQLIFGLAIGLAVCFSDQIVVREETGAARVEAVGKISEENTNTLAQNQTIELKDSIEQTMQESIQKVDVVKSTKTTIPFVKDHEFDYAWLSPFKGALGWYTKWAIYVLMIVVVVAACSNGTNLTDGMDGLAGGTSAIVGVVLAIFAWLGGNIINSEYLNIMYIPGSGEIVVFMAAFVGALIGFLWHNSYPAQVFMGDTGSLMLGGIIGVCAILIRKELLVPILCGVFFVESLSVIIQRTYFKITKRKFGVGKRVFKMAPLHHHFQKEGIPALIQSPSHAVPEAKIVVRFWIISIILAVATIAMLKIR